MAKKPETLTREEFASLLTVGNMSAVSDPPAVIPAEHSARLIGLGYMADLRDRRCLGNALKLILTGGQVHDITQAEVLLRLFEPGALLADKAFDADHFADSPIARAIKVVIPPKQNRKVKRDCDLRALLRAQSRRAFLLYNQAFSGDREARRRRRPVAGILEAHFNTSKNNGSGNLTGRLGCGHSFLHAADLH